ncbi:hypothetical protein PAPPERLAPAPP_05370 [Brevundimonas phage vB_BpoS-Papperlapapp]|nr:hypothetical protein PAPPERLAPAPP_05370 [Brevundimonas phage vB_BpoS-Papperlapapp]
MSNALVTSTDDYYAALAAEAQSYRGGGGGSAFLKFNGNDGYYSYGADDTDLEIGTQAAMDPRTLKRGWICWKDGKVQEEIMMTLEEGVPPQKHLLPDYGPYGQDDGWSEQKTIEFVPIEGDAPALLFQANNRSKMNALEAVMKDFARQFKNNPGMVPVIELGANEFEAKPRDGGRKVKKHAPKFTIKGWITQDEFAGYKEGEGSNADDYAAEGEVNQQAALPAPEPTPEPAAEAPKRGGRRDAPASAGTPRSANAAPAETQEQAAPAAAAPAGRGRRF